MPDYLLDRCYALCTPPCILEEIDGETVIINLDSGNYYSLQAVTTAIVKALASGVSPQALAQRNGWTEQAVAALKSLVQTAVSEGVLRPVDAPEVIVATPNIAVVDPAQDIYLAVYTDMQELLGLDPIHDTHEVSGWPSKV